MQPPGRPVQRRPPVQQKRWPYTDSIGLMRQLMEDRMYPLTLSGLDAAIAELSH